VLNNDSSDTTRTESLTIHSSNTFNIHNLYPNIQTNNLPTTFAVVTTPSTVQASVRPSILRKRHAEGTTMYVILNILSLSGNTANHAII